MQTIDEVKEHCRVVGEGIAACEAAMHSVRALKRSGDRIGKREGLKMKGILVLSFVLSAGMTWANWIYDPNNPNPSQHDIWNAEQNAFEHDQKAVEAMRSPDTWASIREQEKANQARHDAEQMRMRMWDNERRENARRKEEENRRWQQENDDMFVVPGASASMLKHINKKRAQRWRQNGVRQWNNNNGRMPANALAAPGAVNRAPMIAGRALNNKVEEMMRNVRKNRRAIDKELKSLGVVNWQYIIKTSGKVSILDAWYELKSNRGFRLTAYKKIYSEEDLISPVDLAKEEIAGWNRIRQK